MTKSIMPFDRKGQCYVCRSHCHTDEHHIFQGVNRQASDDFGLFVHLCRVCHRRVHDFPETFEKNYHLKSTAQNVAMERFGWDIDTWREHFRKDYRE